MARASILSSSSTGTGDPVYFSSPVQRITAVVGTVGATTAAGSFLVQASVNGEDWTTIIAASTFASTRTISFGTSTGHLYSMARAALTAHSAGAPVHIYINGK